MTINYQTDEITLSPFSEEVNTYSWDKLRRDGMAALSVCLMTIPQAMAYALLAGLPVACGLFASIFAAFVTSLFGSSRHLVVGPSNAVAILVQAGISDVLHTYYRHLTGPEWDFMAVQVLTQLVLLTAVLQLLAAVFKLGRLVQFVSHSVIIGYIAGTAIAVVVNQLFNVLGIERMSGVHSFYERAAYLVTHLHQIHFPTTIIGFGSILLIAFLKKVDKRIPAAGITIVLAAIVVQLLELSSFDFESEVVDPYSEERVPKVVLIGESGNLLDFIPRLSFPSFDTGIMNELLPVAFALALLGIMETTSVAKTIAVSSGQRLSINQEILGIGLGNLSSSFIGGMPVSGSPSRSPLNYNSGAVTRLSAMLNAVFAGLLIFFLGNYIAMVPLATLGGLLLYSVGSIVNPRQFFMCLKATKGDALVLWLTLLSCIFFSLDVAFYIGVVLSVTLYLKKAAIPHLVEYDVDDKGELHSLHTDSPRKGYRLIKVEGELFFGAADLFQSTLKAFAEDDHTTKAIILQLKNTRDMDATTCLALQQLHDYLKGAGCQLILCGIMTPLWEVLSDSGLVEWIGKENLFLFEERHPHAYMQRALQRAKELVHQASVPPNEPIPASVISVKIERNLKA